MLDVVFVIRLQFSTVFRRFYIGLFNNIYLFAVFFLFSVGTLILQTLNPKVDQQRMPHGTRFALYHYLTVLCTFNVNKLIKDETVQENTHFCLKSHYSPHRFFLIYTIVCRKKSSKSHSTMNKRDYRELQFKLYFPHYQRKVYSLRH